MRMERGIFHHHSPSPRVRNSKHTIRMSLNIGLGSWLRGGRNYTQCDLDALPHRSQNAMVSDHPAPERRVRCLMWGDGAKHAPFNIRPFNLPRMNSAFHCAKAINAGESRECASTGLKFSPCATPCSSSPPERAPCPKLPPAVQARRPYRNPDQRSRPLIQNVLSAHRAFLQVRRRHGTSA